MAFLVGLYTWRAGGVGLAASNDGLSSAMVPSWAGKRYSISSNICGKSIASISSVLNAVNQWVIEKWNIKCILEDVVPFLDFLLCRSTTLLFRVNCQRRYIQQANGILFRIEREPLFYGQVQDVPLYRVCHKDENELRKLNKRGRCLLHNSNRLSGQS